MFCRDSEGNRFESQKPFFPACDNARTMYDYKVILGAIAAIIGIVGYIPYYRDILRGTTKPHPFSWIGFALLLGITFFAQVTTGAGSGAWVNGVSMIGVLGIAILSLAKGHRDISRFDWVCFLGALVGIVLWRITGNALTAVVIVTIVDMVAFAPTYRKAYLKPQEETASLFALSALKYVVSLCALASINLTTALFPVSLVVSNGGFVLMLFIRRRQLAKSAGGDTMARNGRP